MFAFQGEPSSKQHILRANTSFDYKILSENRPQFCSELLHLVYLLMGVQTLATNLYHAMGNRGTEHVNCTIAQMSAYVVNKRQDNLD